MFREPRRPGAALTPRGCQNVAPRQEGTATDLQELLQFKHLIFVQSISGWTEALRLWVK